MMKSALGLWDGCSLWEDVCRSPLILSSLPRLCCLDTATVDVKQKGRYRKRDTFYFKVHNRPKVRRAIMCLCAILVGSSGPWFPVVTLFFSAV
jgi:hypothetical protein